ncbi:sodium- and chloride-dependent creatine transporter 1-like [Physella acuta]|uniref:sodium- and chloride-dependent creatine transporter 1-like n=1 Tax=Physella acuta TaxID=109671 RepID=UPI0027DD99B2|nr:sodium- and chloride-dependent creatine transporter 1-like [Physella acuta]
MELNSKPKSEKDSLHFPITNGDVRGDTEHNNGINGNKYQVVSIDNSSFLCELSQTDIKDDGKTRHIWPRKIEYVLTTIGFCVGMSNVLRFPYVCMRNGGGAFLIPYILCLTVCGIPRFFLEVSLGQFMSRGPLHVWSICPLFNGIGISMNILSFLSSWYFCMIFAYILIYLVNSMKSPLPWTLCGQAWNTPLCVPPGQRGVELLNGSRAADWVNMTQVMNVTVNVSRNANSASAEFWRNNVLELSSGLENLDGLPWHTTVALLVSTSLTFACIIKGIHSVGKVVYITALLPYLLLTVLIIKGATLPGAVDGVLFYVYPDFSKLLVVQTWLEACIQVFYSLGPAYGGLFTMASYNKFQNNCMRDAIVLCFVCEGTSVFAGFAIFLVLGHMAYNLQLPLADFSQSGAGLAFVVYPEAISYLPLPQLWGVLFFFMLVTIALDSQFTLAETVLTTLQDIWPRFVKRYNIYIKLTYGVTFFLVSLPLATRGGMYLFQLIDWYFAAFAILLNAFLECVVVAWIYGAERFLDDLNFMFGRRPPYLFSLLWRFIVPAVLIVGLGGFLASVRVVSWSLTMLFLGHCPCGFLVTAHVVSWSLPMWFLGHCPCGFLVTAHVVSWPLPM